ncbi:MAG: hypothetical protein JST16_06115 [Bdellovibrionales bacterium]|nr:hypothetical protein [Bdellovibrionales bacterium]
MRYGTVARYVRQTRQAVSTSGFEIAFYDGYVNPSSNWIANTSATAQSQTKQSALDRCVCEYDDFTRHVQLCGPYFRGNLDTWRSPSGCRLRRIRTRCGATKWMIWSPT